jgi:hypothetical protein
MGKGLTGFQLKIIALLLMTCDHSGYYLGELGEMPLVLRYLGRLSAPLFLFMVVEGYIHTSNRQRYLLRLYLWSVGMGVLNLAAQRRWAAGLPRRKQHLREMLFYTGPGAWGNRMVLDRKVQLQYITQLIILIVIIDTTILLGLISAGSRSGRPAAAHRPGRCRAPPREGRCSSCWGGLYLTYPDRRKPAVFYGNLQHFAVWRL